MNGSVEATWAMQRNMACTVAFTNVLIMPKDLRAVVLEFVGVFHKSNQLDRVFDDINGSIDFEAGKFRCYRGWRFAGADELGEETRNTVVFVDDVFCYNPFHIWTNTDNDIQELYTDRVYELAGPALTVGEILDFVLKCELDHRPNTQWFGSPDHHHVYFEHFEVADLSAASPVWKVYWGS